MTSHSTFKEGAFPFSRRLFLELSATIGAGLLLPPLAFGQEARGGQNTSAPQASLYLSPVWLLHSVSRLSVGSRFVNASLKYVLRPDIRQLAPGNAYLTGAAMPFGLEALAEELQRRVEAWKTGAQHYAQAQQLAVLIGAVICRKIQTHLEAAQFPDEIGPSGVPASQVYQDAFILRTWLTNHSPFASPSAGQLHSLFRQMLPRAFTRFHTLMPDEGDGAAWVMNLARWRQQTDQYLGELAAAVVQPRSEKTARYVHQPGFIKDGEWILVKAAPFNNIRQISRREGEALLKASERGSICARSLAEGYAAVVAIGDYLSGKSAISDMQEAIGR